MGLRVRLRRGTAAEWAAANPVLALGEPGFETDTGRFKVGDGQTAWSALAYASGVPGPMGLPGPMGPVGPQGPAGIGAPQRQSLRLSTAVLQPAEGIDLNLAAGTVFHLLLVSATSPCWLRVYGSDEARSADERTSPGGQLPPAGQEFYAELVFDRFAGGQPLTVTTGGSLLDVAATAAAWQEAGVTIEGFRFDPASGSYAPASLSAKEGGFGIAGGLDPGEVDTIDGSDLSGTEVLRLSFAQPLQRVSVGVDLLFDGETAITPEAGSPDSGYWEQVRWTAFGAAGQQWSGTALGSVSGAVEVVIEPPWPLLAVELMPLDDGAGAHPHNSDFTVRSVQGLTAGAAQQIRLSPAPLVQAPDGQACLRLVNTAASAQALALHLDILTLEP